MRMSRWFLVLLAACVLPLAAVAQPAWNTVTLPHGITGKAERFFGEEVYTGEAEPQTPDQREFFEIHREWVRSELYEVEGGFGWVLRDFTMDTYDDSITYNIKSMRGSRMNRLALYGNSRSDGISPISWIRMLYVRSTLGEPVHVESSGSHTIYTCQAGGGYGKFRVFVDSSGRVVRAEELFPGSTDIQSVYEYQDWISLGSAGEHPQTIRSVIYRSKQVYKIKDFIPDPSLQEPLYTVTKILEMKPLTEDAEPTGYTLPADAIIHDYIDEVLRDGNMNIIGEFPKESWGGTNTAASESPPFRLSSGWLAGAGVLMLVSAAVIWEVRRRRG